MIIPCRLCLFASIIILCFFGATHGGTWTFWKVNPSSEVGGRAVAKNQRQHQPGTDKKGSLPQAFLCQEFPGGVSQTTVLFLKVVEELARSLREFILSPRFDEFFYEDDFQELLKGSTELRNIALDKPQELRENLLRDLEDARANVYKNLQKIDGVIQGLPLCAREVIEAYATGDRKRLKDALEPCKFFLFSSKSLFWLTVGTVADLLQCFAVYKFLEGMEEDEFDDGIERLRQIALDDKDISNILKVDDRILHDPMKWDAWVRKSYAKAREFLSFRRN